MIAGGLAAAALVLNLCAQQPPASQSLSVAEATRRAQTGSPQARAADARVAAANARIGGVVGFPSPNLVVATHAGSPNAAGTDEDIILSQTFELGDKRRFALRAARAERDAAIAERNATLAELTSSVRSAYYEALRSDVERQLAADALETARTFEKAAETQFQAGDVPRSNVLRAQVEVSRAETALGTADADRANRYATLRSLTGTADDTPLALTDKLDFSPADYRLPEVRELALKNRYDVQAARLTRDARAAAVKEAKAKVQPDLFLEGRHADIRKMNGDNTVRVGVTFPLFDLGKANGDTRTAEAALAEQEAVLADTIRTARLEVETAYRNLEQARRTVESFRSGRLDRSRQLLEMAQTGYAAGANTYIELLDAQQVYRTEQTEYARALAAYNTARAQLEKAVGGKLP